MLKRYSSILSQESVYFSSTFRMLCDVLDALSPRFICCLHPFYEYLIVICVMVMPVCITYECSKYLKFVLYAHPTIPRYCSGSLRFQVQPSVPGILRLQYAVFHPRVRLKDRQDAAWIECYLSQRDS